MTISPNARNILFSFSKLLGIDDLEWDEDGLIELKVDDSNGRGDSIYVSIACQDNSDVLILCSQILPQTKNLPDKLLCRFLSTNTKLQSMGGASLAIVPATGALVLQQSINLEGMDSPDFEAAWVSYLNVHDKLSVKLQELAPDSDDDSAFGSNSSGSANFSLDDLRCGMFRV